MFILITVSVKMYAKGRVLSPESTLHLWDLVGALEAHCEPVDNSGETSRRIEPATDTLTAFSPTLRHCISLTVTPGEAPVRTPPSADRHKFVSQVPLPQLPVQNSSGHQGKRQSGDLLSGVNVDLSEYQNS